jgi:hypothetical protein
MKPENINILGKDYKVIYCDNVADVDRDKREALWGQIDYWERVIRVYDNGRQSSDLFHTILHEIIHGISEGLNLKLNDKDNHDELDVLSLGLTDVFFRNGWIK